MDIELFTEKLTEAIRFELWFWRNRLSFETMRAFSISVIPYEGFLGLNFLTINENFDEARYAKWDSVADWRWYNFPENSESNWEQVKRLGLLKWMTERVEETDNEMEFVQACVKALTSEQVRTELKKYNLADDFEVGVFKGDGGNVGDDINHCPSWK